MPVSRLASALRKLATLRRRRKPVRRTVRRRRTTGGILGMTNLVPVGAGRRRRGRPRKVGRPRGSALVGGRARGSAPVGGRRRRRPATRRRGRGILSDILGSFM